jgi:hypothetical protein
MNDMIQTGFDYAELPVDAALNARAAAERIKLRLKRTVEDIIEIGRELTAVKEDLPHGQFLPWIAAEFEMSDQTARNFMMVSDRFSDKFKTVLNFTPKILYALSAPSTPESVIDKAIEKAESGEKVTVADVKDWKTEEEQWKKTVAFHKKKADSLQQELAIERQRAVEWKDQWKAERDKPAVEKAPDDYETLKETERELRNTLADVRQQQARIVNEQVRAKLQEHHQELEKLERDKETLEGIVERKKAYLDSLSSEVRRIETHREVINGSRLELISLAAFLNDLEPMSDPDTIQRWLALADMHEEAMKTIRLVFGNRRPELTLIHGEAA